MNMVTKNMIKLAHSLELKKNRKRERLFIAEGPKTVGDMIRHYTVHAIFALEEWTRQNVDVRFACRWTDNAIGMMTVDEDELRRISLLQNPQQVIALLHLPDDGQIDIADPSKELCIALDGVQDPGNLGTIIRIADWFGIRHIICSPGTADAYNPKTVQATMGSLSNVCVTYRDLDEFMSALSPGTEIYGTLLDGKDIYSTPLSHKGLIVMGNEGNGISENIRKRVTHRLLIPDFNPDKSAESLNVSIATAIVCSEFRRRNPECRNMPT